MDGQALASIFHAKVLNVIWVLTSLHLLHQTVVRHAGRAMASKNQNHPDGLTVGMIIQLMFLMI